MVPFAGVAHLVERDLAKVEVASSSLVARSKKETTPTGWVFLFGDIPFRRSFLHHGRGEALDGGAELGVADDEVDGGGFLLGHHDPLPLVHGDL